MVAGMMATIVLGGITIALSQLGSAKAISRQRLEAFSRCDTAIRTLRHETSSRLFGEVIYFIHDYSSQMQRIVFKVKS